jgi:hypothetical protein
LQQEEAAVMSGNFEDQEEKEEDEAHTPRDAEMAKVGLRN